MDIRLDGPTWSSITVFNNPKGKSRVSFSTAGCGCCSDGESMDVGPKTIEMVRAHILDLQAEIILAEQFIKDLEKLI